MTIISPANALHEVVNGNKYALEQEDFRAQCRHELERNGVLVLPDFLLADAITKIKKEGEANQHLAFYTAQSHNVYLREDSAEFASSHPRNRQVNSSKGCITTDQIPNESVLRVLYDSSAFKDFLCAVLGESALYEYADPLSSINLHYAAAGQELGWHFDNSSFAITLLIQAPQQGGEFEYVKAVRNAEQDEMNYPQVAAILDDAWPLQRLSMDEGGLVLFRGRNALHRVTPVEGERTRMLVVLAYNTEPNIALSTSARQTFYGRQG